MSDYERWKADQRLSPDEFFKKYGRGPTVEDSYFDVSEEPSEEEAKAWLAQWNSVQRTLIEFGTKDRARFLSHYRPVVYQESIAELVDLDDLFDDVSEEQMD